MQISLKPCVLKAATVSLLSLVISVTSSLPGLSASDRSAGHGAIRDKWALLVGVDKFQDTSVASNKEAVKNVEELANSLRDPIAGKFAADHVMTLTGPDATKSGVEKAVHEWLLHKALPDDLVVVYFSSEAARAKDGSPLILTYDTLASEADLSGVDLRQLMSELKHRTQSNDIVCIVDASPINGSKPPDYRLLSTTGTTYISATDKNQQSLDNGVSGTSVFIHHLVEGLRLEGGMWTLQKVFDHVARSVANDAQVAFHTTQTPVFSPDPANPGIAEVSLGMPVRSSMTAKPGMAFGHPVNRLAIDHPNLSEPHLSGKGKVITKSASKKDDDDDDDDAPKVQVDYSGYMAKMKQDIQAHWHPPKGLQSRRITAVFTITRDGRIVNPSIVEGSGVSDIDKSAMDALSEASPLDPLPPGSPRSVDIKYKFDWNVNRQ